MFNKETNMTYTNTITNPYIVTSYVDCWIIDKILKY